MKVSHSHKFVKKNWGSELWIVNKNYCGKILTLEKAKACSIHRHIEKDETFLVFDGKCLMEIWPYTKAGFQASKVKKFVLRKADSIHLPINTWHRFTGLSDLTTIIEFSTHHSDSDVVRLDEGK